MKMKKLTLLLISLFIVGMTMAQTHWTSITGNQYNMTVRGIIVIDGETQASNQLEIGAFCGEECRGSRIAALFPPTGEYTVMLTIKSNVFSGETITFRIYDHALQQELNLVSESTLEFVANTNAGSMGNWFPFVFTTPESNAFHFTTAGQWSNPSNWQGGALPGSNDEVFIDASCQLDVDATVSTLTVTDGYSLTLQSGTTLNVTGTLANAATDGLFIMDGAQLVNASSNVGATVEKNIVAYGTGNPDGWYTIASPMEGMEIEGSGFVTPNFDLYRYDETNLANAEWQNYKANHPDFTTFEAGRGYLYANSNTFSPAFTGTLNAADVTYPLTCTERPDAFGGFNLIGNPFPHVIYKGAGGAIDNEMLASGYYTLTNEGSWHVHTFDDAVQPGQGILVKTSAATELNIVKSNAAATAESGGAKAAANRLDIIVTGSRGEDRCFAYFSQGIGLDKMENFAETAPTLWIRDNGRNYAIAHVNGQVETMDLMLKNKQSGTFTLKFNRNNLSFDYLHLIDHLTGADVDLLQNPVYTFQANGNEYEARFMLVFRHNTGVNENEAENEHFAYCAYGKIHLMEMCQGASLQVIDMTGRVMVSVDGNTQSIPTIGIPSGIYILRLVDGDNVRTQKLFIH